MKIRNLAVTLTITAFAAVNVMASEALLSPRAAENQTKSVRGFNADPNLAAPGLTAVPPRVLDNELKTVPGKSTATTPSSQCVRHMAGSPKMIGQCAEHPGAPMSCCSVPDKK